MPAASRSAISPGFVVPLLKEGWDQRYGRKVETSRLLGRANASAHALAGQIGADGRELLDAIDADPVAAWMNTLPKVTVLRTVWDQQYERTRGGRLRLKDVEDLGPAAERVHSPHDPDARYSTKTAPVGEPNLEWVGSKCHLTESCDADTPNLVTDVHTTPATDPDVTATTDVQDKLTARDLTPGQHLTDAGYPSSANFAASAKRGITLIAPVIAATGRNAKKGTFTPLSPVRCAASAPRHSTPTWAARSPSTRSPSTRPASTPTGPSRARNGPRSTSYAPEWRARSPKPSEAPTCATPATADWTKPTSKTF